MNRLALVAGGGLISLAIVAIRKVREQDKKREYVARRQCVLDLQFVRGTSLSEQQPNFEVKTKFEDIFIFGTRIPNEDREGWFDYRLAILLEGSVRAASLRGSVITLRDANGTWLGQMDLWDLEEWTLDGSIMLPDPEVHFAMTRGIADGTIVFSRPD